MDYTFNVRVKVQLSTTPRSRILCLAKHRAMKKHGVVEVKLHTYLISALDGGQLSYLRPGRFPPGERPPVSIV
jgi:hypothetical protein